MIQLNYKGHKIEHGPAEVQLYNYKGDMLITQNVADQIKKLDPNKVLMPVYDTLLKEHFAFIVSTKIEFTEES